MFRLKFSTYFLKNGELQSLKKKTRLLQHRCIIGLLLLGGIDDNYFKPLSTIPTGSIVVICANVGVSLMIPKVINVKMHLLS